MTAVQAGNLFANIPAAGGAEAEDFAEILGRSGLKIERIVSQGHASPPGFWYDRASKRVGDRAQGWRQVALRGRSGRARAGGGRLCLHPGGEAPPRRVDQRAGTNRLARRSF